MARRYTIIWSRRAVEQHLANIVVQAMESGHRLLDHQPGSQGESRSGFERVLIVAPLAVVFEVYDDERVVYISSVRYSPRRP